MNSMTANPKNITETPSDHNEKPSDHVKGEAFGPWFRNMVQRRKQDMTYKNSRHNILSSYILICKHGTLCPG
jgi:hypothetical protein